MKNKKLEKYVDEKTNSLNDKAFLDELKQSATPEKNRLSKKSLFVIGASSLVTVALLIAIICVVILYDPVNKSQEHYYSSGDENRRSSTVEELNADTVYYDLRSDINADADIVFDTVSNDDLYYEVNIDLEDTFENVKIVVVTNKFYDYKFEHFDYTDRETLGSYVLNYIVMTQEEDGIYTHKVDAEIITSAEKIYITYEGLGLEQESNFIYCIEQLLAY